MKPLGIPNVGYLCYVVHFWGYIFKLTVRFSKGACDKIVHVLVRNGMIVISITEQRKYVYIHFHNNQL